MKNLIALLLATGEAFVDATFEECRVQIHLFGNLFGQLHELRGVHFRLATVCAHGVDGGAQELQVADAGNLHRILECQENTFTSPLFGFKVQQVLAVQADFALGYRKRLIASQHLGQGTLA